MADGVVQLAIEDWDLVRLFEQDEPLDSYYWCMHCNRTYPAGLVWLVDGYQMCPYEGCDGTAVTDAVAWHQVREWNPALPEVPEWGVVYSVY